MDNPQLDAPLMINALPYMHRFKGSTIVIKYGGNAMVDTPQEDSFAHDLVLLKALGIHPVVVHGGGPQISHMLHRFGKKSVFVEGFRVTDAETMEIVQMVLVGIINKNIVDHINQHGGQAVGLTGKDGALISARKLCLHRTGTDNEAIDLGQVGEIEAINPKIISVLNDNGFIPIIAPLATGVDNQSYNINSDVVAGKIAAELKADLLLLLTNTAGLLDSEGRLILSITAAKVNELINSGTIHGGMLPKVRCALDAVANGVNSAIIADGRVAHAVVNQLFTAHCMGTSVEKAPRQ